MVERGPKSADRTLDGATLDQLEALFDEAMKSAGRSLVLLATLQDAIDRHRGRVSTGSHVLRTRAKNHRPPSPRVRPHRCWRRTGGQV